MSSITPVSYQPTYIPVTPVRPVAYDRSRPPSPGEGQADAPTAASAPAPGTGTLLDIKV